VGIKDIGGKSAKKFPKKRWVKYKVKKRACFHEKSYFASLCLIFFYNYLKQVKLLLNLLKYFKR